MPLTENEPDKHIFLKLWHSVFLFSVLLILLQFYFVELAFDREAIQDGEYWRLLTANLVHLNWVHLAMNLAGLCLLVYIFYPLFSSGSFFIYLFVLSILESLYLFYFSQGDHYLGLSSSLYGMYLIGAFLALHAKKYLLGFSVIIIIFVKVIRDFLYPQQNISELLLGAKVATDAHLVAVILAFVIGVALYFFKKAYPG